MDRPASLNTALDDVHAALRHNDHARALSQTAELLSSYPEGVRVWRARASTLESAGQFEAAAEAYNRVLDVMPADAAAMSGYARSLSAAGRALEAGEAARQALDYEWDAERMRQITRAEFKATTGRIALARGQFQAGMHNRAFGKMRGLLEQQPSRADAHVVLAELLWQAGARHVAAEVCDTILASHPNSLSAHAMLMSLARRRGDAVSERHHAAVIARVDPDHRETFSLLGEQSSLRIQDVPAVVGVPGYVADEDAATRSDWVDQLVASTSAAPTPATRTNVAANTSALTAESAIPSRAIAPKAGESRADIDANDAADADEADAGTEVSIVTYGSGIRDDGDDGDDTDNLDDAADVDVDGEMSTALTPVKPAARLDVDAVDVIDDDAIDAPIVPRPLPTAAPVAVNPAVNTAADPHEGTAAFDLPPLDWSTVNAIDDYDELETTANVPATTVDDDDLPPARAIRATTQQVTDEGVLVEPLDWSQDDADADADAEEQHDTDAVVFGAERGARPDAVVAPIGQMNPVTPSAIPAGDTRPATAAKSGAKAKPDALLSAARQAVDSGDIDTAAAKYEQLIAKGKLVDAVVDDLETATLGFPSAKRLFEALGQAHTRRGNIPAALEAYRRALEIAEE